MNLIQFADSIKKAIVIRLRPKKYRWRFDADEFYADIGEPWAAARLGYKTPGYTCSESCYGNGRTPNEAYNNLAKNISGKTLIWRVGSSEEEICPVPTLDLEEAT